LAEWHKTRGRHEIGAKGKNVELARTAHSLDLPILGNRGASVCCGCNPADEKEILTTIKTGQ